MVAKGSDMYLGYSDQNIIIGDKGAWDRLLSELQEWHIAEFAETDIDFNTFQVIAAFDE